MGEIEQIVLGLEGGQWSLAESLREYERAIGRLKTCYRLLDSAERHVALLAGFDADGNPITEMLEEDPAASLEAKRQARSRHRGITTGATESGDSEAASRHGQSQGDRIDRPTGLF